MTTTECPHCGFHLDPDLLRELLEKAAKKHRAKITSYDVSEIMELWNAFAGIHKLPKVQGRNRTIDAKLRIRLAEKGWPEAFLHALRYIAQNSFFQGVNDTTWKASLTYLLQAGKAEELAAKQLCDEEPTHGGESHGTRNELHGSAPAGSSRLSARRRAE